MYWEYLKAVLSRALQPTVRVTDGLQILAASASPAVGKLLGVKMTDAIGSDVLAYIGAAAVAFIVIRLFWAPYSLWKDDKGAIENLRNDLRKPERLVTEKLARHRAKAIIKIIEELHTLQSMFFAGNSELNLTRIGAKCSKISMLSYKANLPDEFRHGLACLSDQGEIRLKVHPAIRREPLDFEVMELLNAFLHCHITAEYLSSQLPPSIEPGTQP